jgi:hypothetical protein
LFFDLSRVLRERLRGKTGFYIADSAYFESFRQYTPVIESGEYELLKEWDIIADSAGMRPDINRLKESEKRLGDPTFWNVLLADRRIYFGKRATLEQDYVPRFSHDRMLAILDVATRRVAELFDRLNPDVVIGFICVTVGEYLAYLEAKARGIPFLNLRPTRIQNYFFAGESIFEPSERLKETYERIRTEGPSAKDREKVEEFLSHIRRTHAMYEGVVSPKAAVPKKSTKEKRSLGSVVFKVSSLAKECMTYRLSRYRHDTHYRGTFYPYYVTRLKRPARLYLADLLLRSKYIRADQLSGLEYALYPLHKEPEVTLLVYSRPFLNQIEVVRNIARSLPVGMKLVIKEHPACIGYRPLRYYKKLLEIPNVIMAPPEMESRELVRNAQLITIISGSVGLEALMLQKPVIHFGRVPFGMLPDNMIRYAKNLDRLAWDICELLHNHRHDEEALAAYIAAVMRLSVPVDFYSVLLGRRGVYRPGSRDDVASTRDLQIRKLAEYLVWCVSQSETGAEWLVASPREIM